MIGVAPFLEGEGGVVGSVLALHAAGHGLEFGTGQAEGKQASGTQFGVSCAGAERPIR